LPGGNLYNGPGDAHGLSIVPVIKITGNSSTFGRMKFNLDFNAGRIMEGAAIPEVGGELLEKILAIASGEPARAELLGHDELFCITRV
jgi:altronate dehydratase large subunit